MVTIKDVARRAGVSVATVSNYLNKTKPVSGETAARVAKAVEELQYTQNLMAKSLKSSVYNSIGVILPNLSDSYYVQIFQGIESAFNASDTDMNLAFSYDIPEMETKAALQMLQKQVRGLIVVTCQPDQWKFYYENFTKKGRPLILIDRSIQSLDTNLIRFDSQNVMYAATKQLLKMGYRNLTLMAGPEAFSCEKDCMEGYRQACQEEDCPETVVNIALNKEDAFRKTTSLLRKAPPDGILATSELTATGIVEALHALGYTKEDVAVVTLGEQHWNKHTHSFAAFSIERPAIDMGTRAAKMLLGQIRSPQTRESEQVLVTCDIRDALQNLAESLAPAERRVHRDAGKKLRVLMLDTPAVHSICRLLKNFEDQTGIRADVELRSHSSLYGDIMEDHNRKENRFDVYMYDIPWLPLLAAGGILKELSGHLDQIGAEGFLPDSMAYFGKYAGGFYGTPLMYAPQMLYYRKDLFRDATLCANYEKQYGAPLKPPKTFAEYNTVAKFFTADTDAIPYGISIPAAYPECLAPELYTRLKAYGSDVIDKNGDVVIYNPNARKAYLNLSRAVKFAKPDFMHANDVSIVEDFLKGETAMLISYPGFLTDATDLRRNDRIGSIGCTHIPGRSPLLGGWSLGISSRSRQFEEAFAFLKWACTEQMATYFSMLGCYSAVSSTYTNDELVNLYPWRPLYHAVYPYTSPMLPIVSRKGEVVSPNDMDSIICKWIYQMFREDCEIEQILRETQRELESLLSR